MVARPATPPGWTRKTCAMVLHLACLGLFGLSVVWPVVGPLASGQVARDFALLHQAGTAWAKEVGLSP